MNIKDLQPRQGNVEIVAKVIEVSEPREFQKFGKTGRVANAVIEDETGRVKLSLWNEQINAVKPGNKIKILQGYVNEFQGEMQLTTGKFGKLEVVDATVVNATEKISEPKKKAKKEEPEETFEIEEDVEEEMIE